MDTLYFIYLSMLSSNAEKKRQLEIRDKILEDSWIHCVLNISMLLVMLRRRDSWRLEIRYWRILGHPSSLIVKGEE